MAPQVRGKIKVPTEPAASRALFLAAALALIANVAHAQTDFATRRIHVIVPYPAGGIGDIATRIVTGKLSEMWH
jgi:tripartite-type tricarboxylate transporter receptor subunit TctC